MKKLLLAASVFTLSTSAMATHDIRDEVFAELVVKAQYLRPLTVDLNASEIDFGNVYTLFEVEEIPVTANIQGQPELTFNYRFESSSDVIALNTPAGAGRIGQDGQVQLGFMVGINKVKLAEERQGFTGSVTVVIQYNDIATIMGNT
jgi:hypothetical protein